MDYINHLNRLSLSLIIMKQLPQIQPNNPKIDITDKKLEIVFLKAIMIVILGMIAMEILTGVE